MNKTAERILIEEAKINFAKFPLDDYQKEMVLSAMKKFLEQFQAVENDIIHFAMYLTGHDEETIEQLYRDWKFKN